MSASKNTSFQYTAYVQGFHDLYAQALGQPLAESLAPLPKPDAISIEAKPKVLIVAPHPDDECLMGGYALRMKEEWNAEVFVVAFSYGSKAERRSARESELKAAVSLLGFQYVGRSSHEKMVASEMSEVLTRVQPQIIFSPHSGDGHVTHKETHALVESAIAVEARVRNKKLLWVQTEFWKDMANPNVLVPLSRRHVSQLGEALMKHEGEVERNPYHLRLPAWFMDQVRKGSERVGGKGAAADASVFGQIYLQTVIE